MKKIISLLLVCALFLACFTACSDGAQKENGDADISDISLTDKDKKEFAAAVTGFAFELTDGMLTKDNLLVSPLSAYSALALCANGAGGDTENELYKVLGLEEETLNAAYADYMKKITAEESPVNTSNSVWYKSGELSINGAFSEKSTDFFNAEIKKENFDGDTVKAMNSWISSKTDGKIKEAIESIGAGDALYLINTLCFESSWSDKYEKTVDGVFTDASGKKQKVDYLASEEHKYVATEKGFGFEKSYLGGKYAFVAMLPKEGVALSEFISTLDARDFIKAVTVPKEEKIIARLPKFTLSNDLLLNDAAYNMGIESLFSTEKCDLSQMGKARHGKICVSKIIHKTYINVCEIGTDASAATIITTRNGGVTSDKEPISVILDRPFFYAIVDAENGIPLFCGILNHVE